MSNYFRCIGTPSTRGDGTGSAGMVRQSRAVAASVTLSKMLREERSAYQDEKRKQEAEKRLQELSLQKIQHPCLSIPALLIIPLTRGQLLLGNWEEFCQGWKSEDGFLKALKEAALAKQEMLNGSPNNSKAVLEMKKRLAMIFLTIQFDSSVCTSKCIYLINFQLSEFDIGKAHHKNVDLTSTDKTLDKRCIE